MGKVGNGQDKGAGEGEAGRGRWEKGGREEGWRVDGREGRKVRRSG